MKPCQWCGVEMTRRRNESASNWKKRQTCGVACANAMRARTVTGPCMVVGCERPRGPAYMGRRCREHYAQGVTLRPLTETSPLLDRWTGARWIPPHRTPCMDSPDLFFPADDKRGYWDPRPAQELCGGCPVRTSCLSWAMTEERPPVGVWGGVRFTDGAPVAVSA